MMGCRRGRLSERGRPGGSTPRPGYGPLGSLLGQRPVDRCHAQLLSRSGGHALPERAHRKQAAARRHARSSQPGGNAEEYATVHTPRLTQGALSACKGGLKQFIHEKLI
jgi:hypothetical protein